MSWKTLFVCWLLCHFHEQCEITRISVCLSYVRKEISFDYFNFSRYTLSMLLFWSREEIYQILTVSVKLYAENLLLLWMCILHFYVMNISNKFFKTFSCNGNYYMQFYSVTQWLMYNDITSWVCNILYIMFNLCYYYTLATLNGTIHITHITCTYDGSVNNSWLRKMRVTELELPDPAWTRSASKLSDPKVEIQGRDISISKSHTQNGGYFVCWIRGVCWFKQSY